MLRTVLAAGHREWWALPMILDSRCSGRSWEDDTLVRFAFLIYNAAATAHTLESRHLLVSALRPHPMLTALVAMMANDAPAMLEAARRCSASETRQLTRIVLSSVARDEGRPAGELDLNMSLWFAVQRDLSLEKSISAASADRPMHVAAADGGLLRMAAAKPPKSRLRKGGGGKVRFGIEPGGSPSTSMGGGGGGKPDSADAPLRPQAHRAAPSAALAAAIQAALAPPAAQQAQQQTGTSSGHANDGGGGGEHGAAAGGVGGDRGGYRGESPRFDVMVSAKAPPPHPTAAL